MTPVMSATEGNNAMILVLCALKEHVLVKPDISSGMDNVVST